MDTSTFIVEREAIQRRMDSRRILATSGRENGVPRLLPWALKAGLGMVTGLKATGGSYGWLGSLAGALVLPALLRFTGHKNTQPESLWQKLARAAFPSLRL